MKAQTRTAVRTLRKKNNAHSTVVGGSTASLVLKCNGSIVEAQYAPVEEWKPWSARGTALHTIMEEALRDDLSSHQIYDGFVGVELEQITITRDMIAAKVLPALEFFDATVPPDAAVHLETKVDYPGYKWENDALPRIEGAFGTGDVFFSCNETNRHGGIDWKFGDGHIVEANDNDQGKFYLCGAIAGEWLPVVEEYEFWIFQPSSQLTPDQFAKKAIYTLGELVDFAHNLADAVTAKPTYETGEHCKWCKGKLTCAPYNELITTAVKTDVGKLSTQDLAKMLDMVSGMRAFCMEVEAAARRNAHDGLTIPGWTLMDAKGDRVFKDEQAALGALSRLGLGRKETVSPNAITAPQALALLRKIGTPEKEVLRFEKRHIERPDKGKRLVKAAPGADTRGAMERLGVAMKARGL